MTYHANRTTFLPMTDSLRRRLEATIDNLIALLDEVDGDENMEPSLGFSPYNADIRMVDAELDDTDAEPSLGWPNPTDIGRQIGGWPEEGADERDDAGLIRPRFYDAVIGDDLELDPADDEPSLGWTEPREDGPQMAGGIGDLEMAAR